MNESQGETPQARLLGQSGVIECPTTGLFRPVPIGDLMPKRLSSVLFLLLVAVGSVGGTCSNRCSGPDAGTLAVRAPEQDLLTSNPVYVEVQVPDGLVAGGYEMRIDGLAVVLDALTDDSASVTLTGLADGPHTIEVSALAADGPFEATAAFSTVTLANPGECEVLNGVECVLPYPSSRFLEPASTETGLRVAYGANTLPEFTRLIPPGGRRPLATEPFLQNDGFSPTTHALMHFPAGVDLELSDAPRIDPTTRTYDDRGLDADSPTLLIDWETGEQINHFVENDVRPNAAPDRVLTILRPGESLLPGQRYIVAIRDLVDGAGQPVLAEPAFAAIRDGAPTDLADVEDARARVAPTLDRLRSLGVDTNELVLAFDFTVMSDHSLTHEMVAMRDQALSWLDDMIDAGLATFTVDQITDVNPGCLDPDIAIWREVEGSFEVPLFLDKDPFAERAEVSFLLRDAAGTPVWNTLTNAPYGVSIPCSALTTPANKAILGHGLFGEGPGFVSGIADSRPFSNFGRVAAATNWSGLSREDTQPNLLQSFIFKVNADPDLFEALPDRLRQGMTNTLVLTRMLDRGVFNLDPAFQNGSGQGVIDPAGETTYLGISLGGIMGTFLAATTPDIVRLNVDVPAINFPLLLYRSTQFTPFEVLQQSLNPDSMSQHIAIELAGSLWARGEPAGYVGHISGNTLEPLPGVPAKQMLVTAALYDQQVTNLGSQLLARSLRIPMLEGSIMSGLPGIPDAVGPQSAGFIVYDTGALDVNNPQHLPFIAPLGNEQPAQSNCDPHVQRTEIPASVSQLRRFWDTGVIENFCVDDGVCNASRAMEINGCKATPCNPVP